MKKLFVATLLAAVAMPFTFAAQSPTGTTPAATTPMRTKKLKKHHRHKAKSMPAATTPPAH